MKINKKLLVLAGICFFIFIIASVVGIQMTNKAEFCISCHEMQGMYDSWKVSEHKEVNCEECHIKPGLVNFGIRKVKSLQEVYFHFFSKVDPAELKGRGEVADVNCLQCHKEWKETVPFHNVNFPHQKHLDQELACTKCHARLVHEIAAKERAPQRKVCLECHDQSEIK